MLFGAPYRLGTLCLLVFLVSGCSYEEVLSALQPSPTAPVEAVTSTIGPTLPSPTVIPTQPTPSFTPTPTLISLASPLAPQVTPQALATPVGTPTHMSAPPTATPAVFTDVTLSSRQIFWGSCSPSSTLVTAHVVESLHIESVQMALRLENPKTGDTTPWGGFALMQDRGGGEFTYRLTAESFSKYHDYLGAWGQFQLIAIDRNELVAGRSMQYLQSLVVAPCP